ncbi:MAG: hypothetical protein ACRYFS_16245 [Janthinobacterium lividum]
MRKTPLPLPAPAKPTNIKTAASKTVAKPTHAAKAGRTTLTVPKPPVRTFTEPPAAYFAGAAGRAWRMSGKHAVAYVHTAALAGELLATEPRRVAGAAMAVYYDRKGRAFAWQFRFDTARWAEVTGRLL